MTDVTDDFNRAGPALGANWTNLLNTIVIASSTLVTGGTTDDCASYWSANTFSGDHYSQLVVTTKDDGGGAAVRMQTGAATYYLWSANNVSVSVLYEVTAGSFAQLGASYSAISNGTTIKIDATGSTLTPYVAGVAQSTRTDSSITGGYPGMGIFSTTARYDDWLGGPITVAAAAGTSTLSMMGV